MVTHPLTTASNIMLLRSHMVDAKDWHPISISISASLESCESLLQMLYVTSLSILTNNLIKPSSHSLITSHSSSHHSLQPCQYPKVMCNDSDLDTL